MFSRNLFVKTTLLLYSVVDITHRTSPLPLSNHRFVLFLKALRRIRKRHCTLYAYSNYTNLSNIRRNLLLNVCRTTYNYDCQVQYCLTFCILILKVRMYITAVVGPSMKRMIYGFCIILSVVKNRNSFTKYILFSYFCFHVFKVSIIFFHFWKSISLRCYGYFI